MGFLSISELEKTFGDRPVLTGVSFQLQPGEKVGLIGPNGSGKTTLLRVIAGELAADRGEIFISRETVVGYLPQKPPRLEGRTLRHHLEEAQRPLRDLGREVSRLEGEIAACSPTEKGQLERLLHRYGELSGQFQQQGGFELESRLWSVAHGLGFSRSDLERELNRFSGGEKTRAKLAALLLEDPDLLLLDEPTNYLDRQGLEWLERYLLDWPRALVVVTHDRFFLDRVVERILYLDRGLIRSHYGNYSSFYSWWEEERRSRARAYRRQQAIIQKEERLIREAKGDERSQRQAASRRKQLEKMETVERPERESRFRLGFSYGGRSGREVIKFTAVSKRFKRRTLFEELSFQIRWGDRVALVGPNGAGKTTLLRLITGEERPDSGEIKLGPGVKVAYFSQEQERLKPEETLLEAMISSTGLTIPEARNHLGRYLFSGEEVFKPVKQLSGGEKCRLALARLELVTGNCLLLDEPTSHLDLVSMAELEQTLRDYPGTLVVVSHDRYFLSNLVNRVFELGSGRLRIYEGSYRDYMERRRREELEAGAGRVREKGCKRGAPSRRPDYRRQWRARRIKEEQQQLEERIHGVEEEIASLEQALADPTLYDDYPRVKELQERLRGRQEEVAGLLERWEEISLQLQELS